MPCHPQLACPCSWSIHCDSCALVSCLDMCISAAQPRQEKGEATQTDTAYHNPGKPQQTQIRVCKQGTEGTTLLQLCHGLTVTWCTQPLTDKSNTCIPNGPGTTFSFRNPVCAQAAYLPHLYLCTGSTPATTLSVHRQHSCHITGCVQGARLP